MHILLNVQQCLPKLQHACGCCQRTTCNAPALHTLSCRWDIPKDSLQALEELPPGTSSETAAKPTTAMVSAYGLGVMVQLPQAAQSN